MTDAGATLWRHEPPAAGWGHGLAAGGALLLSALLHYVVLERFPELPVGEVPGVAAPARMRPVALRDVRRDAGPLFDRPERFRAEDPAQAVDLPRESEVFVEAIDPAFVAPERPPDDRLAGQDRATLRPDPPEERIAWEPRQDILKIEELRAAEDARAAPRRFVPPAPRVPDAPEIQALADAPPAAEWTAPPAAGAEALLSGALRRPAGSGGPLLPEPVFAADEPADADALPPVEASAVLGEAEQEAAAYAPVEQVLAVKLWTFRPPDEPELTYFQIDIVRREEAGLPVLPRDVLILQDCSESMTQRKLNDCKEGIHEVLDRLGPTDRFELVAFRETVERCFGGLVPADARGRAKANYFVEGMEARGKTDVYASLEALMTMSRTSGRPFIVLLVTDGRPTAGLVDSSDIIETFTRRNQGNVSMFALGGGRQVNRFLLDLLSYRNRGDVRVEEVRQDIPGAMRSMAEELRRPVLMNLRPRFSGIDDGEIYPATLTHLYLDRPLSLYGCYRGRAPNAAFQIVGAGRDGDKDMVFRLDWAAAEPGGDAIRTRWAWHKIYHLIGAYIGTGREDLLTEMHGVADRYRLPVPYGRDVIYR